MLWRIGRTELQWPYLVHGCQVASWARDAALATVSGCSMATQKPAHVLCDGTDMMCHAVQYADQGFLEVDGTLEWDNDYPNPVSDLSCMLASASRSPAPQNDLRRCIMFG